MRAARYFDWPSMLIVLAALTGNAQIKGFDVVLTLLLPSIFIVTLLSKPSIRPAVIWFGLFCGPFFILLSWQALTVGVPYFELYALWPFKCYVLCVFALLYSTLRWPIGNHFLFFVMCLLFLSVAHYESGRMFSFFGPNMLYRFFGLFFVISFDYWIARGGSWFLFSAFGAGSALATGSAGAFPILLIPFVDSFLRGGLRLKIFVVFFVLIVTLVLFEFWENLTSISIIARALYKFNDVQGIDRFSGWLYIIGSPLRFFGHTYYDFAGLWTEGYEYPHNLFVELLGYYGVPGIACCVGVLAAAVFAKSRMMLEYRLFLVLMLGAMFSGDLSDNFGVISIGLGVIFVSRRVWRPA